MAIVALFASSCSKTPMGTPVVPTLDIQSEVVVEAEGGTVEINLRSSYPWFASTTAPWITMVKYRGQMKLPEKIIIEVDPNNLSTERIGTIKIKLMDQMTSEITIKQKAQIIN